MARKVSSVATLTLRKRVLPKTDCMGRSQDVQIAGLDQNPPRLEEREHFEPRRNQEYHKAQEQFSVHALEPDRKHKFCEKRIAETTHDRMV
jgi:hypothetical protein